VEKKTGRITFLDITVEETIRGVTRRKIGDDYVLNENEKKEQ